MVVTGVDLVGQKVDLSRGRTSRAESKGSGFRCLVSWFEGLPKSPEKSGQNL